LSEALRSTPAANARLAVLVHAAEDLTDGISHDGPRTFSQAHFDGTKDREDVPKILTASGVRHTTLVALGLLRSPCIGLGGPVSIRDLGGRDFFLSGLAGPVRFRPTGLSTIAPAILPGTTTMAVVENLQAAEAACDRFPAAAVAWCAGQPADVVLDLLTNLAISVESGRRDRRRPRRRPHSGPDRHGLGQIPNVLVVDAGVHPHPARRPFGDASVAELTALADGHGTIARFAQACLDHGYPMEHEATIHMAFSEILES
jgi:hypothetical protein